MSILTGARTAPDLQAMNQRLVGVLLRKLGGTVKVTQEDLESVASCTVVCSTDPLSDTLKFTLREKRSSI